ncbi:MAG: hypothetical protein GXP13_07180 [Gammaproteobacteria bacterium]|nr:hypothetical protein [Gammaproteobacteria bacterium]
MKRLFLIILSCVALIACRNEGIVQSDAGSYLSFTGNTKNAFVSIDNGKKFSLEKPADDNSKMLHQVTTGKHDIVVTKGGAVIVHRKILIGSGMTKEIYIK